MSQHDMVLDNGPGLAVRTDMNAALQALASISAGPVEPATTYPGQLWLDTTVAPNGRVRQRNLANTAWVDFSGYAPLDSPAMTGNPTAPTPDVADDDTSVATTEFVKAQEYAQQTAEKFNRIVNPAMQISQENGDTASASIGYYMADQWLCGGQAPGGQVISLQRVSMPASDPRPIRMTVTTGASQSGASNHLTFQTSIEGQRMSDLFWGSAAAKQIVLRFGWKSPAGTYAAAIRNAALNRCYLAEFTVAAGEANVSIVKTLVIPGDVTGTWGMGNGAGLILNFTIAANAAMRGVAGWQAGNQVALALTPAATVSGQVFELFNVGLYADPALTGRAPPFEVPDLGSELLKCQRYFWRWSSIESNFTVWAAGSYFTTTGCLSVVYHPVPMRAAPIINSSAASTFSAVSGGTAIVFDVVTSFNVRMNLTTGAAPAAGHCSLVSAAAVSNAFVNLNARM
jgi:hypothetical protein